MQFQTIVAAINFEDDLAPGVLKAAVMLAKRDKAKLWVVDVWPNLQYAMTTGIADPLGATAMIPSPADLKADKDAKTAQENKLNAFVKTVDPSAQTLILEGDPAEEITSFAREKNADVIVVGTHQKGAWKALFDGAPSRDIVRESPCAIFLVPKAFATKILTD